MLSDNHPDDKYLYEIVVETGPMAAHATTSKVNFILTGDEEQTDVRLVLLRFFSTMGPCTSRQKSGVAQLGTL